MTYSRTLRTRHDAESPVWRSPDAGGPTGSRLGAQVEGISAIPSVFNQLRKRRFRISFARILTAEATIRRVEVTTKLRSRIAKNVAMDIYDALTLSLGFILGIVASFAAWRYVVHRYTPSLGLSDNLNCLPQPAEIAPCGFRYRVKLQNQSHRHGVSDISLCARLVIRGIDEQRPDAQTSLVIPVGEGSPFPALEPNTGTKPYEEYERVYTLRTTCKVRPFFVYLKQLARHSSHEPRRWRNSSILDPTALSGSPFLAAIHSVASGGPIRGGSMPTAFGQANLKSLVSRRRCQRQRSRPPCRGRQCQTPTSRSSSNSSARAMPRNGSPSRRHAARTARTHKLGVDLIGGSHAV